MYKPLEPHKSKELPQEFKANQECSVIPVSLKRPEESPQGLMNQSPLRDPSTPTITQRAPSAIPCYSRNPYKEPRN